MRRLADLAATFPSQGDLEASGTTLRIIRMSTSGHASAVVVELGMPPARWACWYARAATLRAAKLMRPA